MAGRFAYEKRRKYPHMIGEDVPVWERFIDAFPEWFESVDYDWRVGEGVAPAVDLGEPYKRMSKALSQKRIDVVGWNGDAPTIVEVKDRAGLSAVGQVLGYRDLWRREFRYLGDPAVLLVCGRVTRDDEMVMEAEGIPVEVV